MKEEKILIKKSECNFDLRDVEDVSRVDVTDDGIEVTFVLKK